LVGNILPSTSWTAIQYCQTDEQLTVRFIIDILQILDLLNWIA
jgi:hypothetical protein